MSDDIYYKGRIIARTREVHGRVYVDATVGPKAGHTLAVVSDLAAATAAAKRYGDKELD